MFFINLVKLIGFSIHFSKILRQFNESYIDSYLQPFYRKYGKEFKESTIFKIKKFYRISILFCCAGYKKMYGGTLSIKEAELAILTAILTPVIDDFTDEQTLDSASIDKLISSVNVFEPKAMEEDVAKTLFSILQEKAKHPSGFFHSLQKEIQAQHWSQRQMEPDVSRDEILEIALAKGGWYQVFCHYIIDEVPDLQTTDMLYLMGGIMQINDDIFDVYVDHQDGIATYANTCDNFKDLEDYYTAECKKIFAKARALPYDRQNIELFIIIFGLLLARGMVALRKLKKLQKQLGGGILPFDQLNRNQLICDMEKPVNILRMIYHAYKLQL